MNSTATLSVQRIHPSTTAGASRRNFSWMALGTTCSLQFVERNDQRAEAFIQAAVAWVAHFEARYSRFRATSLLSGINAAAGKAWVEVDPEMEQMLDVCGTLHAMTQGILDVTALPLMRLWNYRAENPRIPTADEILAAKRLIGWAKVQRAPGKVFLPEQGMSLDFGGWGKEFAVDAVAEIAREHRIEAVLVDFGHDLRALGAPSGKPAWHVGLEDPKSPGNHRESIAVKNRGVASSGDYLRSFTIGGRCYGHIIDPRTGRPVSNGCLQTTVVAPTCLQAGVLSTVSFILGPEAGLRLIQENQGVEGLIVTEDARYQTRGFFNYVVSA